jgi:hypothetical protein
MSLAGLILLVSPRRRRRLFMLAVFMVIGGGAVMTGALIGCGGSSAKATNLVITSTNTKVASGLPLAFQATIASANNNPTGTVTFYDGGTAIGTTSAVDNNAAVLNISSLAVGTHTITAKYSGDSNNQASQSADALNQTITGQFTLIVNATAGSDSHPITVQATLQ